MCDCFHMVLPTWPGAPGSEAWGGCQLGVSKFKMPKFKMPSFGVSASGKPVDASLDVSLPSTQAEVKTCDISVELPSAEVDVKTGELGVKLPEGHLPKVQMPSIKMPKVDFKGPQVDLKGPKVDVKGAKGQVSGPEVDVALPSVEVDMQAPGARLEGDLGLGDKEAASKFKMPKFKMPSFGVSASGKPVDASLDVSLPSTQAEVKTGDISVELPSAEVDVKTGELGVKLPEGHLPKVQMPSIKMPKVDFKGPQVDLKGPKVDVKGAKGQVSGPEVDVALPSVEVDMQAPGARLEGDLGLGDKEAASKFKMPKFKMPSFGVSASGKPVDASLDVSLPSTQAEVKTGDISVELPSAEVDVKTGELGVKLPEGHLPKVQMPSIKMPKVDFKGPQVDLKGPKVDVKGAKGQVSGPEVDVALPSVEVDMQAPGARLEGDLGLGDKEAASKFKMPKFKMPSFGVSASGKPVDASLDVSLPSTQAEVKTGDISVELPSAEVDVKTGELGVKLPEGHLPKVQMPSIKMPKVDFKGPQVDLKGPKVDVKGAKGQVSGPEVDVALPSVEVDMQAPGARLEGDLGLGDKEAASKFKMPKFKMPSFGVSASGKPVDASLDVSLPSTQAEVKTGDISVELPSAEVDVKTGELGVKLPEGHLPKVQMPSIKMPKVDFKGPQVDLKGPKVDVKGAKGQVSGPEVDVALPSVEVDMQAPGARLEGDLGLGDKEAASKFKMPKFKMPSFGVSASGKPVDASLDVSLPSTQAEVKTGDISVELPSAEVDVKTGELGVKLPEGHLPKVQMPSIKMPKVDFKGPQVDLKGPKVDVKGAKGQVSGPEVDVALPSVEVDMQAPGARLEGDLGLGDKEAASKFKMPKFKMPSFGVSASGKPVDASLDVSLPSTQAEVKTGDISVELPSAEVDVKTGELGVKLPEGHLPKVQMPSIKMPKVDFKGPQVDLKGPKVDVKGAKGQVSGPEVDVALPSVEVDMQAPGARLEGDLGLGDKEAASKFKMPKFKMPSFGVSASGKPVDASLDVSLPSTQAEVKTGDISVELPSAEVDVKTGELGVKLPEGHLPKVQMPSIKMPKVDFKGPQVDLKGPKVDVKGAKGQVSGPEVDVALPSVEVDMQAPGARLEGDLGLGDKEAASKFKMPKFKMPSFGVSASGKPVDASLDVSLPSTQAEVKTGDISVELPSAEVDVKTGELGVKLPEGHLPKVQMPSIKMPKVDIKGPKLDLKGPQLNIKSSQGKVVFPHVDEVFPSVGAGIHSPCPHGDSAFSLGDQHVSSQFRIPEVWTPCVRPSSPKTVVSPDLSSGDRPSSGVSTIQGSDAVHSTSHSVFLGSADGLPSGLNSGEKSKITKQPFKISKMFSPPGQSPAGLVSLVEGPGAATAGPAATVPKAPAEDQSVGTSWGPPLPGRHLGRPGVSSASHDIRSPLAESSVVTSCERVTLTKYQETLPRSSVSVELGEDTCFGPQGEPGRLSTTPSADPPSLERVPLFSSGSPPGPGDALTLPSDGRVTFPKFHGPKFKFLVSGAAAADAEPQPRACGLSLPSPALVPAAEEAAAEIPTSVSVSQGMQSSLATLAVASGAGPAEDTDREGRSSPLKMPRLRLPSFRRSPKKEVTPKEEPGQSLAVEAGVPGTPGDGTPETDAEKGKGKTPGFAVPKLALPKMKPSKGGDPEPALAGAASPTAAGVAPHATPGAISEGPPESMGSEVPLLQVLLPGGSFTGPDLRPSPAAGGLSPPAQDPSLREGSRGHKLGADVGEAAAPAARSQEGDSAVGTKPAGSQDSWFRMPSLRLPSFWRSSKERGAAGGPGVAAPVSPPPPEAEGEALRRSPDTGTSWEELPTAESTEPGPGESCRPLQASGGRPFETQPPPGERGGTPAGGAGGMEHRPSPPEGPLTLKASRTHTPAQVSVVHMRQLWADSVLTVKFPALKVPRFTFPDPGSEVDIFIPPLSEARHGDSSHVLAQHKDGPGVRGTSFLKAGAEVPGQQPVALDFPSDTSPISKVRVHIQGTQVESQEVTIHSRVTAEVADLPGPGAFSTQIVREAEVPASQMQTPSYGFSLLTGRVLETPLRAQVHLVSSDPPPPEGFQEAAEQVAPGALHPDTGEPFEIISSSSILMTGPPASAWETYPGPPRANSCSDEEPAEILEFTPDVGRDQDSAAAEKPGSQRPSGRFRFWLPSIGFSPAGEVQGGPEEDRPSPAPPAPVQTQPEAHPGAELPKKPEKASWFRFPKLGFSSSPSGKRESAGEDEAGLAGPKLQEDVVTFFDARESFSVEEPEGLEPAEASGSGSTAQ
ncbi:protein AHNAK2 [Sturnira hondurensis]|uniref:protein AHNAK2 n=1 Tax=Sturnira hondurensis TaxID=192404 RepID=UPI001879EFA2|nr:protein AHNAK2 [Sturnira hondurensis]